MLLCVLIRIENMSTRLKTALCCSGFLSACIRHTPLTTPYSPWIHGQKSNSPETCHTVSVTTAFFLTCFIMCSAALSFILSDMKIHLQRNPKDDTNPWWSYRQCHRSECVWGFMWSVMRLFSTLWCQDDNIHIHTDNQNTTLVSV